MPTAPPSFGSQAYWDNRFTANPNPFEWLESPTITDPALVAALKDCGEERPEVLHVGCGTSLLSYHLRAHVKDPEQIHNVDYSQTAIEIGKKREIEIFRAPIENGEDNEDTDEAQNEKSDSVQDPDEREVSKRVAPLFRPSSPSQHPSQSAPECYMRWSHTNLLSLPSLLSTCNPATYSIIMEKSTSDSIACSDDIPIFLPYPLYSPSLSIKSSPPKPQPPPSDSISNSPTSPILLHPLHILALHLALLTKPGGYWVSVSYSSSRFPFLPPSSYSPSPSSSFEDDEIPENLTMSGFPHPGKLWELERMEEVVVKERGGEVGKPKIVHWIYVLKRTETEILVREG